MMMLRRILIPRVKRIGYAECEDLILLSIYIVQPFPPLGATLLPARWLLPTHTPRSYALLYLSTASIARLKGYDERDSPDFYGGTGTGCC